MQHHPVLIGAPRDMSGGSKPALLQRTDEDFVESTLDDLRSHAGRQTLQGLRAKATNKQGTLKLFQPIQRQFHVALVEAWCDLPGLPRIDAAKIDSAGMVLRRLGAGGREGWMRSKGRVRGWVRLARVGGEANDPGAALRLRSVLTGVADIDRQLTGFALENPDSLLNEDVIPLYVAPPDVCSDAGKTLLYGIVPTISSEISESDPVFSGPGGADFGPQSKLFRDHLVEALRGDAMDFPFPGEIVRAGWFDAIEAVGDTAPEGVSNDQFDQLSNADSADSRSMRRFLLLLRQLSSEFNAFDGGTEAADLKDLLHDIQLPLKLRYGETTPRQVRAGDFLAKANTILLQKGSAGDVEMPQSWPALSSTVATKLAAAMHDIDAGPLHADQGQGRALRRARCPLHAARLRAPQARRRVPRAHRVERVQRSLRHCRLVRGCGGAAGADPAARSVGPQPAQVAQAQRRLRRAAGDAEPVVGFRQGPARRQGQHGHAGHHVDLQLQHPHHHDLRVPGAEHFPDAVQHRIRLDVLPEDLHPVPEIRQQAAGRRVMSGAVTNRPLLGWPLLPLPDEHGVLAWPDLAKSVRDAIRIILSTRPSEQLMRPEFGGGLDRLLHEPNTVATRRQIRDLVQESLARWEKRILLDGVEVWEVPGEPSQVRVEIAYRLARTGAPGAMNVTVELEG